MRPKVLLVGLILGTRHRATKSPIHGKAFAAKNLKAPGEFMSAKCTLVNTQGDGRILREWGRRRKKKKRRGKKWKQESGGSRQGLLVTQGGIRNLEFGL